MKNVKKTLRLDVDFDLWLTETEIEASVYIGNTDEPQLVVTESLETLIDRTLETYGWSDKIHIYQSDNFFNTKKMIVP